MFTSLLLSALATSAAADVLPPKRTPIPILGRWEWKSDKGDCAETYEYLPNGLKRSQSGEESIEKRYTITPIRIGEYAVSETITTTNGKPDCVGAVSTVGRTAQLYLFILDANKYLTCATTDRATCFGVASRQR